MKRKAHGNGWPITPIHVVTQVMSSRHASAPDLSNNGRNINIADMTADVPKVMVYLGQELKAQLLFYYFLRI